MQYGTDIITLIWGNEFWYRPKARESGMAHEQLSPTLQQWSVHLAEDVIPEESDLAPFLAGAYITGGKEREALFRTDTAPEGSFIPGGLVFVLPYVFAGIQAAAPHILSLITSASVSTALTIVCNIISLHDKMKQTFATPDLQQRHEQVQEPVYSIRQIVLVIDEHLKKTSLPEEERERIAYRVIRALLEQPEETIEAIGRFEETR